MQGQTRTMVALFNSDTSLGGVSWPSSRCCARNSVYLPFLVPKTLSDHMQKSTSGNRLQCVERLVEHGTLTQAGGMLLNFGQPYPIRFSRCWSGGV